MKQAIYKMSRFFSLLSNVYFPIRSEPQPSCSTSDDKNELLKVAPRVPYNVDLKHWGSDHIELPLLVT